MKNSFRPGQKQALTSKDVCQPPVSSEKDVRAFLTKVAAMPKSSGEARLIFSLDATASRQATHIHESLPSNRIAALLEHKERHIKQA